MISLYFSPSETYTISPETNLIQFCQSILPTVLPCQFKFDKTDQSNISVSIIDLIHIEMIPVEELLETRLLCSKRSWINYLREYDCFEVYSLHPKDQSLRRSIYYTDITSLPSYYCTPVYLERKNVLTQLLRSKISVVL